MLPPHPSHRSRVLVNARGWDSTAKVISRFIGSDIYHRRVYFYCVPFSEICFFFVLFSLLPFLFCRARAPVPVSYFPNLPSFEYNLKGRFCQTSTLCPFGLRAPSVRRVTADATVEFGLQTTYVYTHTHIFIYMYVFARVLPRHRPHHRARLKDTHSKL